MFRRSARLSNPSVAELLREEGIDPLGDGRTQLPAMYHVPRSEDKVGKELGRPRPAGIVADQRPRLVYHLCHCLQVTNGLNCQNWLPGTWRRIYLSFAVVTASSFPACAIQPDEEYLNNIET